MRVYLVPSPEMDAFLSDGIVSGSWHSYEEERAFPLRQALRHVLGACSVAAGRVVVWWQRDYDGGECELEDTLCPLEDAPPEWSSPGVDSVVVEIF